MNTTDRSGLMGSDLPFDERMCPHLRTVSDGDPVRRIRTPAGADAWLVTGYTAVKTLLRDPRLGRSHPDPDARAQYAGDPTYDMVISTDHATADTMHHGIRTLLKPEFAVRRMAGLEPRIGELAEEAVDRLLAKGPPADLRADLADPLTRLVLCELIGVPRTGHTAFVELAATGDFLALGAFLSEVVAAKRARPDDTLLSRLCATGLPDEQVVHMAALLNFAGFGATSKQIVYGFLLLSQEPEQRAALAADPDLLPVAVEELLRLSGSVSLPRYAREPIALGGVVIAAGDLVLLDLTRANYDLDSFADPAVCDPARSPNRHLSFSSGPWSCLGAPLARMVLRISLGTLLTRLPELAPVGDLGGHQGALSGGLPDAIPITW